MRHKRICALLLAILVHSDACAQRPLTVRPDKDVTVVMRYILTSQNAPSYSYWSKVTIPPQGTTFQVPGPGLYRVACFLQGGASATPAGPVEPPVDLWTIAEKKGEYTLDCTFHENRNRPVQIMSATLVSQNGQRFALHETATNSDSELVDDVVQSDWDMELEQVNRKSVRGVLFLNKEAKDGGPRFTDNSNKQRFRPLPESVAYEQNGTCHIVGRWQGFDRNLRGEFHFQVDANNPDVMTGQYWQDGRKQAFGWSGRRR